MNVQKVTSEPEYLSASLRIRIVNDRGTFSCEFARARNVPEWFDEYFVLRALGDDASLDALIAQQWSLREVARRTRESLGRIIELFEDGTYSGSVARFRELQRQRETEVLASLSHRDNT